MDNDDYRIIFWTKVLEKLKNKSQLFAKRNPVKNKVFQAAAGYSGITLRMVAEDKFTRVVVYIDTKDESKNKKIFDTFHIHKEQIEKEYGKELEWEPLPNKRACRIKLQTDGNIQERDYWDEMINFLTAEIVKFEKVFLSRIEDLGSLNNIEERPVNSTVFITENDYYMPDCKDLENYYKNYYSPFKELEEGTLFDEYEENTDKNLAPSWREQLKGKCFKK